MAEPGAPAERGPVALNRGEVISAISALLLLVMLTGLLGYLHPPTRPLVRRWGWALAAFGLVAVAVFVTMRPTLGTTIANLGFDEIAFPQPVFAGDTIWAETEVVAARKSKSRPDVGIVEFLHRGYNQRGEEVCFFRRKVMVPKDSYLEARGGEQPGVSRDEIARLEFIVTDSVVEALALDDSLWASFYAGKTGIERPIAPAPAEGFRR